MAYKGGMMLFTITTDWHWNDKRPSSRIDNYQEAMVRKIRCILSASLEYEAPILHAGDMTDTSLLSYSAYMKLLSLIKHETIYGVAGQHDLLYRNRGNTPLDALEEAISSFRIINNFCTDLGHGVHLYGCSFGEEIPGIEDPSKFNILLIHKMIVDQHMEQWEEEYPLAPTILKNTNYELVVSGDNHKGFIVSTEGKKQRHLINCGSLMRSKIDQIHHKPFFCIFDTDKRTYEKHYIPIQDWGEVFDLETKVKEDHKNEMLSTFVSNLSQHKKIGLHFKDNVIAFMEENNIEQDVRNIVNESMVE